MSTSPHRQAPPRTACPHSHRQLSAPRAASDGLGQDAANKLSKDGLNAKSTNTNEGRDDVVDCDVVCQVHVSAHISTSSVVDSESLVGQLFHIALLLGLFASSLCLSLCLCGLLAYMSGWFLSLSVSVFLCLSASVYVERFMSVTVWVVE